MCHTLSDDSTEHLLGALDDARHVTDSTGNRTEDTSHGGQTIGPAVVFESVAIGPTFGHALARAVAGCVTRGLHCVTLVVGASRGTEGAEGLADDGTSGVAKVGHEWDQLELGWLVVGSDYRRLTQGRGNQAQKDDCWDLHYVCWVAVRLCNYASDVNLIGVAMFGSACVFIPWVTSAKLRSY